jgi:ketopantoate reductase
MAQARDMLHSMAEPTDRDRDLFLEALSKLCVTNPSMALVALSKVMVPAIAAAREAARREAIEECAKIAKTGAHDFPVDFRPDCLACDAARRIYDAINALLGKVDLK